jgi:hypothetical protein
MHMISQEAALLMLCYIVPDVNTGAVFTRIRCAMPAQVTQ